MSKGFVRVLVCSTSKSNWQIFSTECGMYEPHCGITALTMSWGHDEYMYHVLKHNGSALPDEACHIIRYHSFYPWHSSGDYAHLAQPQDQHIMDWVNTFK